MACRRVNHQSLGLVDDQHIFVLIDDVQLHFGGRNVHLPGFRHFKGDLVTRIQLVVFLSGLATQQNAALLNELLCPGAA